MGLLDRMKEVITVDISGKISYGSSILKLSGEIKSNERAVENLIVQVGKRCVENHINDKDSEYDDLFREILELRRKNREMEEQIQELKRQQAEEEERRQRMREEMKNSSAQNSAAQNSAEEDSAVQNSAMQDPPAEEGGKFCGKCGKPNDGDAAFCVYCGAPFESETVEKTDEDAGEDTDVL